MAGAALPLLLASAVPLTAAPSSTPPNALGELDFLRRECVAAARVAQQREEATLALVHDLDLLDRDVDGRQRGLDESRTEQAQLLGALVQLARHPPEHPAIALAGAFERSRGELVLQATIPALRNEARALSEEIKRIAALRQDIAARQGELASARKALEKDRAHLADLVAHRLELTGRLQPEDGGRDARIVRLGREAIDIPDLIKRAEAAADRRDKELLRRARTELPRTKPGRTADSADPTRPRKLHAFEPPHSMLQIPVSGTMSRGFGALDASTTARGTASEGISFAALPGAEIVAPFDGRIIYAGPFRDFGLVLIIRHGGLYHSLLAGLGRVDIAVDRWVLAGEPVGALPDAVDKASVGALYVELRQDSRPVDPQPLLAPRDQGDDARGDGGRDEPDGDQKVPE